MDCGLWCGSPTVTSSRLDEGEKVVRSIVVLGASERASELLQLISRWCPTGERWMEWSVVEWTNMGRDIEKSEAESV